MIVADLIEALQKMPQHQVVFVAQCVQDRDEPALWDADLPMLYGVDARGGNVLLVPDVDWPRAEALLHQRLDFVDAEDAP